MILIHDFFQIHPKVLFTFNYMDNIGDINLILTSLKYAYFDSSTLLAFGPMHFLIINRSPTTNTSIFYKTISFDSIANAEFMPFSNNCII